MAAVVAVTPVHLQRSAGTHTRTIHATGPTKSHALQTRRRQATYRCKHAFWIPCLDLLLATLARMRIVLRAHDASLLAKHRVEVGLCLVVFVGKVVGGSECRRTGTASAGASAAVASAVATPTRFFAAARPAAPASLPAAVTAFGRVDQGCPAAFALRC